MASLYDPEPLRADGEHTWQATLSPGTTSTPRGLPRPMKRSPQSRAADGLLTSFPRPRSSSSMLEPGQAGMPWRHHGARDVQKLSPPRVEQTRADGVVACDLGRRQLRTNAFRDNLALLVQRPRAPTLASRDDLQPLAVSAPTTSRMSALIQPRGSQNFVYRRLASQQSSAPLCAADTPLTS